MRRYKTSRLTAYILIALIVFALVSITALQSRLVNERQELTGLRSELDRLEQQNLDLESRIAALGSDESVEQLARERLSWVYDNEVVYIDAGE